MAVLVPVGLARYFPSANHIIININPRFIATPPPFYMEKERERGGGRQGGRGIEKQKRRLLKPATAVRVNRHRQKSKVGEREMSFFFFKSSAHYQDFKAIN